ncbi:FAD-dependent monooxygenase [Arthrobacter gengyunqii]|uniref:FAD-dependent monooxygenase n=1 Tax=Arthrobacter gengyunqii TaxID=2886940 RepID=A0A9X1M428_9MICC|nr:NAD(P)/FAD-dependent oxidoreductase [Arthrobacter gengyunqii]MCC3270676.1 FAD-dependent monooxygenase [Arthrobacter gengyunqii]UOY96708.1 FAD-dependent monooxygenase [Arthrobacter gengyunqii]
MAKPADALAVRREAVTAPAQSAAVGAVPRPETDVAVVGGGPVGVFLGVLLAQAGVSVQVLEQRLERSAHSRAIGIHPPSLDALAAAGVDETITGEGVQIRRGEARSNGQHVAALDFSAASERFPYVLTLPQLRTEAILEARLHELDPGALVRGVKVTDLHDDGGRVRISGGRTSDRGADGSSGTGSPEDFGVSARIIVAADGARSGLRQLLGTPCRTRALRDTYLMGDFADSTGDGSVAVLYLESGGIVESFPLPGGIRRWVAHTDQLMPTATAADLARTIGERTGISPDPASNTMLSAFAVRTGLVRNLVRGRTVLIGDAAHEVSPIGGQGMNLGWLDAAALTPIITASLGGGDVGTSLAAYERERRGAARVASVQAQLNMALGRPLAPRLLAARNAGLARILRAPAAGNLVARRFTMQ